ncbi:hypothetical protein XAP412_260006 [Xanthomonas phaseoli pv. phaseoli]|uniref:Thiopurine S-methyltransferase n=1 Tax=Xanthomonas campestris pv. phaseoli TaxID=317013 RepID=A0AB38DYD2_XANCH|nr:hypothetical protein XAP6984_320006 [Xanthomonas phaseoli pv. phaseoli]SON82776.1 hypothetical protein XAP412_260006 [Xanthomonas phaseoli pv. phaseoli]SON87043.1 hypothetical protein XAP7430_270006 [Xanthomonas phaseoli pv. phaseoli]SOO27062.1 hypothetical protein XAP6164_1210006 [Xanthomonas phaseoli pv. phaseoli]
MTVQHWWHCLPNCAGSICTRPYARLPAGCGGLLITLDYPQAEKAGPPFAVDAAEVHALFDGQWQVQQLEQRDILEQEPRFRAEGVTALTTAVYRLQRC